MFAVRPITRRLPVAAVGFAAPCRMTSSLISVTYEGPVATMTMQVSVADPAQLHPLVFYSAWGFMSEECFYNVQPEQQANVAEVRTLPSALRIPVLPTPSRRVSYYMKGIIPRPVFDFHIPVTQKFAKQVKCTQKLKPKLAVLYRGGSLNKVSAYRSLLCFSFGRFA